MILLDTHVWVWWVHGDERLKQSQAKIIERHEGETIGISAISCWEVAKLVELKKLSLPGRLAEWMTKALGYPGVQLIELTPEISIESTELPGEIHRDPADQIIVATARLKNCVLVTSDQKLLDYPYVNTEL